MKVVVNSFENELGFVGYELMWGCGVEIVAVSLTAISNSGCGVGVVKNFLISKPQTPSPSFASLSDLQDTGKFGVSMATRTVVRHVSRRFSSSGKVLSEEEKAAENVYIKKKEQEKLEKLARKIPKPEETATASSGGAGSISEAIPSSQTSSTSKASTDKYRNYAVLAGLSTAFAAFGWYYGSKKNKSEEVHD
ncbi:unnamed protein product [Fraxinus pennsylvanica]|uniref:Copper ion binding protein n=1 Tax=Fraxinus pennsylvanica TaxID=56036 RepID=A0AAD2A4S2_9LAMI|nr:unnamed protein product [Fraxinus pennsylvanica]